MCANTALTRTHTETLGRGTPCARNPQWSSRRSVVGRKTITINYENNMHSGTVSSRACFAKRSRRGDLWRTKRGEQRNKRESDPKRGGIAFPCFRWLMALTKFYVIYCLVWPTAYTVLGFCAGICWCGGLSPCVESDYPHPNAGCREKRALGDHHTQQ